MLEKEKISVRQFTVLVILFTIGSSILVAPSGLASLAKQDAWMSALLGLLVGVLLVLLYNVLGNRFPDMNLAEYSELILGKWGGKFLSFLYFTYFFLLASALLREIGDFMTTQVMPETPIQAVHIIFLAVVIMGVRLGLETFTRAAEIFLPWVIFLFLFLVVLLLPEAEFTKMKPWLEGGIKPIIRAAFPFLGLPFLELVIFLMFFPYVNQSKKVGKAFLKGTLIGGTVIVLVTALAILVLGSDYTSRSIYPSFILAKKINVANFLQRLEALMAGIWFITIYMKITICYYAAVLTLSQMLNLKEYRFLLFPLGMILVVLSLVISPNTTYFHVFMARIWTPYSLTFGLVLPLLLLAVSRLRQLRGMKIKSGKV